jgi:hypothetical protein
MLKTKTKRGRKSTTTIKAVNGKQLTDEEIKAFVAKYEKDGNFPGHKIPCTVTGKLSVCVGPWLRKKVKEYGSAENLLRNYKSRAAKKQERILTMKPKAIGAKKGRKRRERITIADVPKMPVGTKRPQSAEEFTEASQRECARPDIYLDNGRHCLDCPHYAICENGIKCLPRGFKFVDGKFVEVRK